MAASPPVPLQEAKNGRTLEFKPTPQRKHLKIKLRAHQPTTWEKCALRPSVGSPPADGRRLSSCPFATGYKTQAESRNANLSLCDLVEKAQQRMQTKQWPDKRAMCWDLRTRLRTHPTVSRTPTVHRLQHGSANQHKQQANDQPIHAILAVVLEFGRAHAWAQQ